MLTQGEDVEAHALKKRGWSISAIARHLERDRKTVRSYLNGDRQPGRRATVLADPLAAFEPYIRARFADDHNLWATALFDEVVALGYERSYPSFVRQIRLRALRPHCEACRGVKGRDTIDIDHPPGEEIQWDWFERRRSPWGATAFVLLGTLPHSSRTRDEVTWPEHFRDRTGPHRGRSRCRSSVAPDSTCVFALRAAPDRAIEFFSAQSPTTAGAVGPPNCCHGSVARNSGGGPRNRSAPRHRR